MDLSWVPPTETVNTWLLIVSNVMLLANRRQVEILAAELAELRSAFMECAARKSCHAVSDPT